MSAKARYAAGAGFIVHKSGERLDREAALRVRAYHERVIASPHASEERVAGSHEDIRQIDAAMAITWPTEAQNKEAAE